MKTLARLLLLCLLPSLSLAAAPDFVALTEKLKPAVVNISTTKEVPPLQNRLRGFGSPHGDLFDNFFEHFFRGQPLPGQKKKSLGSGFIISTDGYILTNAHVVDRAEEIKVQLDGHKTFDATVKGVDSKLDLALLKIETSEALPTVTLGNSDELKIGEWVMAIGNPFGLEQTVTVGIVSAKGRVIGAGPYDNFIQTDASINPGNSGGPLFNTQGEVIGINTAIVAGGQGIGFAIPINAAKAIVPQLKETGHVTRGWLGVTIQQVSDELAASFGLEQAQGALVSSVAKNSPADKAGLQRGDIILEFNNQTIDSMNDLPRLVAAVPVGDKAELTLFRKGKKKTVAVKVGALEDDGTQPTQQLSGHPLGLHTSPLTEELRQHYDLQTSQGVLVTAVDPAGPAARAGLQPGDVIIEYNGVEIRSNADLEQAARSARDQLHRLLIQRGQGLFFVALRLTP
jgi:serine protease Do